MIRFEVTGARADLDEAIESARAAVESVGLDPHRAGYDVLVTARLFVYLANPPRNPGLPDVWLARLAGQLIIGVDQTVHPGPTGPSPRRSPLRRPGSVLAGGSALPADAR